MVKNFFHNNMETRKQRLPNRIRDNWTALSVYALLKSHRIARLADDMALSDPQGRPPIAFWTKAQNDLFWKQSEKKRAKYERRAAQWNVQGPDDEWKPR